MLAAQKRPRGCCLHAACGIRLSPLGVVYFLWVLLRSLCSRVLFFKTPCPVLHASHISILGYRCCLLHRADGSKVVDSVNTWLPICCRWRTVVNWKSSIKSSQPSTQTADRHPATGTHSQLATRVSKHGSAPHSAMQLSLHMHSATNSSVSLSACKLEHTHYMCLLAQSGLCSNSHDRMSELVSTQVKSHRSQLLWRDFL